MSHSLHSGRTAAVALALLIAVPGCPGKKDAAGGTPRATTTGAAPDSPAHETEWTAVRVDPRTYAETDLGVVAISNQPPFRGRLVSGGDALKTIVDEMNALDHVMSTGGLGGPGTKILRNEDQYFRIMRGNWLGKARNVVLQVRPKAQARARRFRAFYNKDGTNVELGLVAMKPSHYLQIVEAKDGEADHLGGALREVNTRDEFTVDIPPPSGAQRGGNYGRLVERGTPLFFTLMRDKLLNRENVVLVDASHPRPAELHRVALTGAGLAQIHWLEVDIDKTLAPASKLAPGEQVRYEAPDRRLAFIVERYDGVKVDAAALGQLAGARFGKLPGFKAGATRPVEIAGRELLTITFRTGEGDAATDHAVALWPRAYFTAKSEIPTEKGLLLHVSAPAAGGAPEAKTALDHAVIAPSIDSLFIDPEWAH